MLQGREIQETIDRLYLVVIQSQEMQLLHITYISNLLDFIVAQMQDLQIRERAHILEHFYSVGDQLKCLKCWKGAGVFDSVNQVPGEIQISELGQINKVFNYLDHVVVQL